MKEEEYEPVLPDASLPETPLSNDPSGAAAEDDMKTPMEGRRRSVNRSNDSDVDVESGLGEESDEEKERRVVLANQLWSPLRKLIADPKRTAYWWFLINAVFVSIGELHRLLIYLLTLPVLIAIYVFLIYRLTCFVAR